MSCGATRKRPAAPGTGLSEVRSGVCRDLRLGEGLEVGQHLSGLYRRTGCLNAAQAAYLLGSGRLAAIAAQPVGSFRDPVRS